MKETWLVALIICVAIMVVGLTSIYFLTPGAPRAKSSQTIVEPMQD